MTKHERRHIVGKKLEKIKRTNKGNADNERGNSRKEACVEALTKVKSQP